MVNKNDIGKFFLVEGATRRVAQLSALTMDKGVLYVCMYDAFTPNPSKIPGLEYFWTEASNLVIDANSAEV